MVDSGYSWVVVISSVLQMICNTPVIQMMGFLFGPKLEQIGISDTQRSAATSLYLFSWAAITLFVGPIVELKGARFVSLCSALCCVGGLILIAFASSPIDFIISFGLISGIGQGLGSINSVLLLNSHFKKKLGIATGLTLCGVGIGTLVLPQVVKILLVNFEIKIVILIYAAIDCLSFIAPLLIRSEPVAIIPQIQKDEKKPLNYNGLLKGETKDKKKSFCSRFGDLLNRIFIFRILFMIKWSLLKSPRFLFVAIAGCFFANSFLLLYSEIAPICSNKGLSLSETADVITICGAFSVATRLIMGVVSDLPWLNKRLEQPKTFINITSYIIFSAALIGLAFADGFGAILACFLIVFLGISGVVVNGAIMMREYFTKDLSSALGITNVLRALMALVQGPVNGLLKESHSTYIPMLSFIAATNFILAVIWYLERYLSKTTNLAENDIPKDEQKV